MDTDDDPEIIFSDYTQSVVIDGHHFDVEIYRTSIDPGWILSVENQFSTLTVSDMRPTQPAGHGSPPDQRAAIRKAKARPAFDDLQQWLDVQLTTISGKSPLAQAIRYALTRLRRLRPYLAHSMLVLDNNTAERAMRPVALGRKNYLFV